MASGNGGQHSDNCNYDGYANSIYTVTIGNRTYGPLAYLAPWAWGRCPEGAAVLPSMTPQGAKVRVPHTAWMAVAMAAPQALQRRGAALELSSTCSEPDNQARPLPVLLPPLAALLTARVAGSFVAHHTCLGSVPCPAS